MEAAERKLLLRREMREVRRGIADAPDDRADRSARIWSRIVGVLADARRAERVMLFQSLPGEPDTALWMAWCEQHGIEVFLPQVDGLDLRVVPGDRPPDELDAVIVPGLAFTANGARLGQGGGHFDRFLPRLRSNCLVIGAGFAEQLVDELPLEPHDARLDVVVTDAGQWSSAERRTVR